MSDLLYQNIPNQSTPVLDPDGTINLAWYRFFNNLAQMIGMNTPDFPVTIDTATETSVVVQLKTHLGQPYLVIYDQVHGALEGYVGPLII